MTIFAVEINHHVSTMKRSHLLFFSLLIISLNAFGQQADSTISYRPNIHGTIRGRFEASTEREDYRFQVRNARLAIDGNIAPFADYFIQADFCDRGKMKILDVYARLWATKEIGFQAGQFRMPFGVDPFRAPHQYYFANRSFIGREICNVRAVGFKAMWHPTRIPITLEAGAFNPNTIGDHSSWHRKLAYAAKLTYTPTSNLAFATGFQSISPDSIRTNLIDGAVTWKNERWIVEGEYMYKHYCHEAHKPCHGYNLFANYAMPVRAGFFNRLGFHGRFDGMTAHSTATCTDGELITNHPSRNRITAGASLSYIRTKNMFVELRADYEKYFYHSGTKIDPEYGDKFVAEIVLRF